MELPILTFYLFAAVILGSALLVVTRKSAIIAALYLALSLLAVAGLYVSLHAEFLFAVQVLVYTGGVMVLFLFVIMLVNIDDLAHLRPAVRNWWFPVAILAVTFGVLASIARSGAVPPAAAGAFDPMTTSNTQAVASVLFTDYLLPFEVVSVLLLVAMVGAIVLSKKEI
jgi:NADH-quinone oxidoreductase subunit J